MLQIYKYYNEKKISILALSCLIVLALILRYMFVAKMAPSGFDPWRHLQLLKNIQDGAGFTLFDGQPYIWYDQVWYYFVSMLGPSVKLQWVSCATSVLSVGLFFLFLLKTEKSLSTAVAGGLMMTAFAPMITYTCTYGSESFAIALMLSAFLLSTYRTRTFVVFISGLLFGMALAARINFLFNCIILIPILKNRRNYLIFLSGVMIILGFAWWRHYLVISNYAYIFTWDGLATKSSDYNIISILVPQLQSAVAEGNRALHTKIAPFPQWFYSQGQIAWGTTLFIIFGAICLMITKRLTLILAGLLPLVHFIFFDKTLSTNAFRLYLAIFPVFFIGFAVVAERIKQKANSPFSFSSVIWIFVIIMVIFSGYKYFRPKSILNLENVTPPLKMLTKKHYMVNSGLYHPETLIYRYPDKKFIGMPLYPEQFDDFSRHYPEYTSIIWHQQFSVQDDLLRYLVKSGKYRIVNVGRNKANIKYLSLEKQVQ